MKRRTRIDKWRQYREDIDSNENIHFSIVNSDSKLKEMFESIDFNIEKAYRKAGYKLPNSQEINKKVSMKEKKEILEILNASERNENSNAKNNISNDFNSHKYDNLLNTNFIEFIDKNELAESQNQQTTDLKINKINIVDGKEK